jgi:hypothetical protein
MKYAIYIWEDSDCDFDIITDEGHLYGFYNAERHQGVEGTICERRFSLNKNLLYNPEDVWDLTDDIKEYATYLPEQSNLEEAISLVLEHIGAENPDRVSIEEINSIIAKIEDTI